MSSTTSTLDALAASDSTSYGRSGSLRTKLELDHAGLQRVDLKYELYGPEAGTPVVVLGGISADRHLAPTSDRPEPGWWRGVVADGGGLDPVRQRLLGIDYVAGPETPIESEAPVTTRDQARAIVAVLDEIGADQATVVGASYGGLVALALAAHEPERVERAVVLCAGHRAHPMATGIRAIQRAIVKLGEDSGQEEQAVIVARALAMTTYRSTAEFEERFDVLPAGDVTPPRFPVEEYLMARGVSFASRFDTRAFYRLSESIDLQYVEPGRVRTPTTLLSVDSDVLAPPWLLEELEAEAPGIQRHVRLESKYGHDAFLKEVDAISALLKEELAR